jgi:hypothetical protein
LCFCCAHRAPTTMWSNDLRETCPWVCHQNLGSTTIVSRKFTGNFCKSAAPPCDTTLHVKVASEHPRTRRSKWLKGIGGGGSSSLQPQHCTAYCAVVFCAFVHLQTPTTNEVQLRTALSLSTIHVPPPLSNFRSNSRRATSCHAALETMWKLLCFCANLLF